MSTATVVASLLALIGVGILLAGAATYLKAGQASRWTATTGKIVSSRVGRTGGNEIKYYAIIQYQYSVGGNQYISDKLTIAEHMGMSDTAKSSADDKIKKYPAGSTVTLYYDPANPDKAILEKGGDSTMIILGGIFLIFAVFIWFLQ